MSISQKNIRARKYIKRIFLVLLILLPPILLQNFFMIMFVPSESMYPSLSAGDFLFGIRSPENFERGDILVFRAYDGQIMIKRLIGLPGEQVCLTETGDIYIDGNRLEEPYVSGLLEKDDEALYCVPDDKLFFLGDNRNVSFDSRYWSNPYIDRKRVMAIANYKILPTFKNLNIGGLGE